MTAEARRRRARRASIVNSGGTGCGGRWLVLHRSRVFRVPLLPEQEKNEAQCEVKEKSTCIHQ